MMLFFGQVNERREGLDTTTALSGALRNNNSRLLQQLGAGHRDFDFHRRFPAMRGAGGLSGPGWDRDNSLPKDDHLQPELRRTTAPLQP